MFFDRGQEEDPYCKLPRLHPDKKHGKVGKGTFSCLRWAMSFVFFLVFFADLKKGPQILRDHPGDHVALGKGEVRP
jgi:hypothetical protein